MLFVCYNRCSTCVKARKWLQEHDVKYDERDIKSDNPTKAELKKWHKLSGLPLKRFFNTSGIQYRERGLKDTIPNLSDDEQLSPLATDGMLVKRPLLIGDDFVLVGFKQDQWGQNLLRCEAAQSH